MLLDDSDLNRLALALFRAGAERAKTSPRIFEIVMALGTDGVIVMHHSSAMEPGPAKALPWMTHMLALNDVLREDISRGKIKAFGSCFHVAAGDLHIPGEIPVFAVRVEGPEGRVAHLRQTYEIMGDGALALAEPFVNKAN